jgi:serine/threonine protein kinase/predicted ATPase
MDEKPPETISHYKILCRAGVGGMGEVYLAEDARLGRRVAIKLLPSRFTGDLDRMRRFEQEARAASALNHPNIITIHEIGESEYGRFIVMEHVVGRTLRTIANQSIDIESLINWGRQIAEALRVAHDAGIVHRDIKPENIMIRDDGYVKVLDFGLARLVTNALTNAAEASETLTDPGVLMGTIRYMAPEQTRSEAATGATDIFALGVIFYELASGRHPFQRRTVFDAMQAINAYVPPAPSSVNAAIPPDFDVLIQRMIEKEPADRPTASDVRRALTDMNHRDTLRQSIEPTSPLPSQPTVSMSTPPFAPPPKTVGRERERLDIRAALAAASAGRGQILCIAGEPGIGKTTLIENFLLELNAGRNLFRVARGRCSERLAGAEAYLPWLEALDSLLRAEENISQARTMRIGESISLTMRQTAPTWYAQVATLTDDNSSNENLIATVKAATQERMKRELGALIEELSRWQPQILFFDDLHWADASTIDMLSYLAGKLGGMRVLILVTYRPSDLQLQRHPFLQLKPELQARGLCREIFLEFLNQTDVERYLALEFPHHRFPRELRDLIYARTEGNPLFLADLTRYLRDRKVISQNEQRQWTLTGPMDEIKNDLPESVRGMIERKISQLEPEDRRLLVAASVQGAEFDSNLLSRALDLDPMEVEDRLEALERVYSFVRLINEGELPNGEPSSRYRFIHVLYQNALYASLRPVRKRQLSAAFAAAMRESWGDQAAAVGATLAGLYETARDYPRAVEFYLAAAERAANKLANVEAAVLARRGLDMLKPLSPSPATIPYALKLHLTLGFAHLFTEGYASPGAGENMSAAHEICLQLGETPELFPAIWGLWMYYTVGGNLDEARRMGERMLRMAESSTGPQKTMLLVGAHFALGFDLTWLGEQQAGHEHLERGRTLYDSRLHHAYRSLYRTEPGIACHTFSIRSLWFLGYPDQARRRMEETLAMVVSLNDPHDIAFTHSIAASVYQFFREVDKSREMAEAALKLTEEYSLAQERQWAAFWLGKSLADLGREDEGLAMMTASLAAQRAMNAEVSRTHYLAMLAEVHCNRGDLPAARETLDEGFAVMNRSGERFYEPELHRLKGMLLLLEGDEKEAKVAFRLAITAAQNASAKSLELRAVTSLARLLVKRGESQEARRMLTEIYEWFREGFETADLKEARALLDELV